MWELVKKIEYKAKLEGIVVEKIGEEYTSGVSSLDKEEISKENYNPKRRVKRGLFITNKGIKINADINGSINILRKYIKKSKPNQEIAWEWKFIFTFVLRGVNNVDKLFFSNTKEIYNEA